MVSSAKYRADDQAIIARGLPMLNIVERQQSTSGITWLVTGKTPIKRADGVCSLTSGGIKESAIHVLPQPFDMLRVLANQSTSGLRQDILSSAFPNASNSGIGFDGDDHVGVAVTALGRVHRTARRAGADIRRVVDRIRSVRRACRPAVGAPVAAPLAGRKRRLNRVAAVALCPPTRYRECH